MQKARNKAQPPKPGPKSEIETWAGLDWPSLRAHPHARAREIIEEFPLGSTIEGALP
jgi:hypothetical protein